MGINIQYTACSGIHTMGIRNALALQSFVLFNNCYYFILHDAERLLLIKQVSMRQTWLFCPFSELFLVHNFLFCPTVRTIVNAHGSLIYTLLPLILSKCYNGWPSGFAATPRRLCIQFASGCVFAAIWWPIFHHLLELFHCNGKITRCRKYQRKNADEYWCMELLIFDKFWSLPNMDKYGFQHIEFNWRGY